MGRRVREGRNKLANILKNRDLMPVQKCPKGVFAVHVGHVHNIRVGRKGAGSGPLCPTLSRNKIKREEKKKRR